MSASITDASRASCERWPHVATLVAVLMTSSCRFGGPLGDPASPVVDGAAGSAGRAGSAGVGGGAGNGGGGGQAGNAGGGGGGAGNGGVGGGAGNAGSGGTSGADGGIDSGGSAGATSDARYDIADDATPDGGVDADADSLDSQPDSDAAFDSEPGDGGPPPGCVPPFSSAVCDPVCNTGCTPLLRCDVAATFRTGVCVGTLLSTVTEGMACTRATATDDCNARLTCTFGICRRLCYRDADCTTSGTCCNMPVDGDAGVSGYQVCAPCRP